MGVELKGEGVQFFWRKLKKKLKKLKVETFKKMFLRFDSKNEKSENKSKLCKKNHFYSENNKLFVPKETFCLFLFFFFFYVRVNFFLFLKHFFFFYVYFLRIV